MKLAFSVAFLLAAATALSGQTRTRGPETRTKPRSFSVVEATIPEMQAAMKDGRVTSRDLVTQYLLRIALYNSRLNAVVTVNPNALSEADTRDRERAMGKARGPLHGIPIALKDNMLTIEMPTTGGALAFAGLIPPYEATLAKNLRDAGAIIIAKTTMTELANWVAGGPTPMPSGYNGLIGYSMNPYDPRRDPRGDTSDGRPVLATGGSSSGVGTAANFWAANVGGETSGSILSPSNQNMLVGIKPTVGRISRYGIIPITADQDTAGATGQRAQLQIRMTQPRKNALRTAGATAGGFSSQTASKERESESLVPSTSILSCRPARKSPCLKRVPIPIGRK